MSLRHNHRRRLLPDDPADQEGDDRDSLRLARGEDVPGEGLLSYSAAAEAARHRALCSLFPLRLWSLGLTLTAGVLLIAMCIGLHLASEPLAQVLPANELTALRLDSPRGLSHWLAGTVMGLTAASAAFIYAMRRHRTDDYYGRYRVWLWACPLALVFGVAETTSLGALTRSMVTLAAERSNVDAAYAMPILGAIAALAVGVRLLIEIRQARLAVTALAAASICFGVGLAAGAGWPQPLVSEYRPLAARGATLLGYWLLLTAALAYCRHVQLAIVGKQAVAARPKRVKKKVVREEPPEAPAKSAPLKLRTDLDPAEPAAAGRSASAQPTAAYKPANEPLSGHLSRAERRKARRETRMAG